MVEQTIISVASKFLDREAGVDLASVVGHTSRIIKILQLWSLIVIIRHRQKLVLARNRQVVNH